MVIVPLPAVRSLVKPATVLPDGAGRLPADTRGAHANSPTGCRTGRAGGVRIHWLMSASVTLPSAPPGFTTANGYAATVPAPPAVEHGAFLLLLLLSPPSAPFSARRETRHKHNRELRLRVHKLLLRFSAFRRQALGRAVGTSSLVQLLGATSVTDP